MATPRVTPLNGHASSLQPWTLISYFLQIPSSLTPLSHKLFNLLDIFSVLTWPISFLLVSLPFLTKLHLMSQHSSLPWSSWGPWETWLWLKKMQTSAHLPGFVFPWPIQRAFPGILMSYLSGYSHGLLWKTSVLLESFCSEHFSMSSFYPCGHNDLFKDAHETKLVHWDSLALIRNSSLQPAD